MGTPWCPVGTLWGPVGTPWVYWGPVGHHWGSCGHSLRAHPGVLWALPGVLWTPAGVLWAHPGVLWAPSGVLWAPCEHPWGSCGPPLGSCGHPWGSCGHHLGGAHKTPNTTSLVFRVQNLLWLEDQENNLPYLCSLADCHAVSNAPALLRPPKLSSQGPVSTGVGDRPGRPQGAVSFCLFQCKKSSCSILWQVNLSPPPPPPPNCQVAAR